MMPQLGRAVLPVQDLDEAILWYQEVFGFQVLFDAEIFTGFRSVHVGPGETKDPGVWLFPADAPASTAHPALVLYSDDIEKDTAHLDDSRVNIAEALNGDLGSRSLQLRDPWGNLLVLTEMPS